MGTHGKPVCPVIAFVSGAAASANARAYFALNALAYGAFRGHQPRSIAAIGAPTLLGVVAFLLRRPHPDIPTSEAGQGHPPACGTVGLAEPVG